ncbi:MAG: SDR family NAD(P)-dependent oxidoreductase [Clostridium sp.]|nr:SDR family NAD(P)-dependent oxidoreductase [Clostridium sp.]
MKDKIQNVIIIGASSGIGRQLALTYAGRGCNVQISGRRMDKLAEVESHYPLVISTFSMDVADTTGTARTLALMTEVDAEADLVILCAGTGELNPDLDFGIEQPTLQTNVVGWTFLVDYYFNRLMLQGHGHLAIITSVGGLRGGGAAPAYNASKAYQMNYLEGLRQRVTHARSPIILTDIRPGLVDTAMAKGEGLFWVMPVEKAARQIVCALDRKRKIAIVTHRWRLPAFLLRHMPLWLYERM